MMTVLRAAFLLALLAAVPAAAQNADFRGDSFAMQGGEAIYKGVCQGCHMADAKGASGAGAYPALAGNPKLATASYVVHIVLNGHKGMPPFRGHFTDSQVADVVNYVRSHFGNHFKGEVKAADVQGLR
jgi:mono/diheme cytochrome c family protein